MSTDTKMNCTFAIRADEETMKTLNEIKEATGVTTAQIVRIGLQKTFAQFKRDGALTIEAQPAPQKP